MPVDENEPFEETSAAQEWAKFAEVLGYLGGGAFQLVAGAGLGYLAGRWIDRKLGLSLALAAVLALLGFAGGVYGLVRAIRALNRRQEARERGTRKT